MYNIISTEPKKSTIVVFVSLLNILFTFNYIFITDIPHKNTLLFLYYYFFFSTFVTFLILYGSSMSNKNIVSRILSFTACNVNVLIFIRLLSVFSLVQIYILHSRLFLFLQWHVTFSPCSSTAFLFLR